MNKEQTMKKIVGLMIVLAMFFLFGCPTTKQSAKSAPDEVGNAAVDEATEAAKEEARKAVREGVKNIFGR
jgi:uncharacterized lipoprotein YajG